MIPAQTRYKTHDGELLAIVEAFKTWRHYLEGSWHEVLMLTDHNNLRQFMDTKILSSRQVCWAQELFYYHFQIDYRQDKANRAADAFSQYRQQSVEEENTLCIKNVKIFHRLQLSLAKVSELSTSCLSLFHQILICGTTVFPPLNKFWDTLRAELNKKRPYKASIGAMRLRLQELQETDSEAQKIKAIELQEGWEEVDGVFHYQRLPYVPKIVCSELISKHHDDSLAGYFGIDKRWELIGRKYYWPSLRRDVETYVKEYDICLTSKIVRHKPYGDLQSLPVRTHQWKNLSIDFVTSLLLSIDWKGDSYNSILVIVNQLIKMMYYEPVKVTIDALGLAKVILDVVVWYHGLSDSIVTNRGLFFTAKFWSSLCYFPGIKKRLSTAFHP